MEIEGYECPNCGNVSYLKKNISGKIKTYCVSCNSTHIHFSDRCREEQENEIISQGKPERIKTP